MNNKLIAFVDGSHINGKIGYGVVIVDSNGEMINSQNGRCSDNGAQNIAGEIAAAITAKRWAEANGVMELLIVHDYLGLSHWYNGTWKANTPLTKAYQGSMRNSKVKLKFSHVKSHSGDVFNEMADDLAKRGTELTEITMQIGK